MCTSLLLLVVVGTLRSRHVSLIFREIGVYCHIRIRIVDITCISGPTVLLRWIGFLSRILAPEAQHSRTRRFVYLDVYYSRWNRGTRRILRRSTRFSERCVVEFVRHQGFEHREHSSPLASGFAIKPREIKYVSPPVSGQRLNRQTKPENFVSREPMYRSPLSLSLTLDRPSIHEPPLYFRGLVEGIERNERFDVSC